MSPLLVVGCASPLIQVVTGQASAATEERDLSQAPCLLLLGTGRAPPVPRWPRSPRQAGTAAEQLEIRQQIETDAAISHAMRDLEEAAVAEEAVVERKAQGRRAKEQRERDEAEVSSTQ